MTYSTGPAELAGSHDRSQAIGGGKAGILIELNAQTGKRLWKLPVGVHSGPGDAGLLTEHAAPTSPIPLPAKFSLEPGVFGGVESQLATNGSTTFAAVNNLAVPLSVNGLTESSKAFEASIPKATGEMIAVNQDTGKNRMGRQAPLDALRRRRRHRQRRLHHYLQRSPVRVQRVHRCDPAECTSVRRLKCSRHHRR